MPSRQPFTALCQALARPRTTGRADLHLHSTCSDGTYTPAQLVDLARRSGLAAIALTDHDTLAGIAPARADAIGTGVEIIAGVEITAEYNGRELHLLGYFVDPDDFALNAALQRLREHRVTRFRAMVERLRGCGVSLEESELQACAAVSSVGRRHLAELLVQTRRARSIGDAFRRFLGDGGRADVPKLRLDVGEAIALVRGAGGVASWAHPPYDGLRRDLPALQALGLGAVEVDHPGLRPSRVRDLRDWVQQLGLAVSAGSDCHGPGDYRRTVGARSISAVELESLRSRC